MDAALQRHDKGENFSKNNKINNLAFFRVVRAILPIIKILTIIFSLVIKQAIVIPHRANLFFRFLVPRLG